MYRRVHVIQILALLSDLLVIVVSREIVLPLYKVIYVEFEHSSGLLIVFAVQSCILFSSNCESYSFPAFFCAYVFVIKKTFLTD